MLNYVLDKSHPALAHQFDVVESLAASFEKVTVLTGSYDGSFCREGIIVECMNWRQGEPVRNVFRLLRGMLRVSCSNKYDVVFSHMTLIQSAILGPIFKFQRIPHFLWYAHKQDSILLRWVNFISSGIVTSSKGSCPISGPKVKAIGQGIMEDIFLSKSEFSPLPTKCVHIGRTDPSKRIELIIDAVASARSRFPSLTLEIVGSPSNLKSLQYLKDLKRKYFFYSNEGWLNFADAIKRRDVPQKLSKYDIFVHAFDGSLDKTLIEATMVGLLIATLNREYINEFLGDSSQNNQSLDSILLELLSLEPEVRNAEIAGAQMRAIQEHSFNSWISRLTKILKQQSI